MTEEEVYLRLAVAEELLAEESKGMDKLNLVKGISSFR